MPAETKCRWRPQRQRQRQLNQNQKVVIFLVTEVDPLHRRKRDILLEESMRRQCRREVEPTRKATPPDELPRAPQ